MARVSIPQAENDCLQSEAMATAPWGAGTGVVLSNNTSDVIDPLGGNTATKLVYDGSGVAGSFMLIQQVSALSTGSEPNAVGLWIRLASGAANVRLTDNASLTFGTIVATTAWMMFSLAAVSAGPFAVQLALYRDPADNVARTWYVALAQAAVGKNSLGAYAKTTVSPVVGPIRNAVSGRVPVSGRVAASGRVTP